MIRNLDGAPEHWVRDSQRRNPKVFLFRAACLIFLGRSRKQLGIRRVFPSNAGPAPRRAMVRGWMFANRVLQFGNIELW